MDFHILKWKVSPKKCIQKNFPVLQPIQAPSTNRCHQVLEPIDSQTSERIPAISVAAERYVHFCIRTGQQCYPLCSPCASSRQWKIKWGQNVSVELMHCVEDSALPVSDCSSCSSWTGSNGWSCDLWDTIRAKFLMKLNYQQKTFPPLTPQAALALTMGISFNPVFFHTELYTASRLIVNTSKQLGAIKKDLKH